MPDSIRILIADDHVLLQGTVANRLQEEPDLEVIGRASNAADAIALAAALKPEIVLMDIDMPGLVSFDAAAQLKRDLPEIHVIFLSAYCHDRYIEDALRAGCSGYLTKDEPIETVIEAIRQVSRQGSYFSRRVRERLVVDPEKGLTLEGAGTTRLSQLTTREVEVLRYVARGMSKKEIAQEVHRSVSTVDKHVENLMRKLSIHDRVELAKFAIREGLAEA